jgi:hypothetical protein
MHHYRIIPWNEITMTEMHNASLFTKRCCDHLKISPPQLHFVEETKEEGDIDYPSRVVGLTLNNAIYILKGQTWEETQKTIAHEVRHYQQEVDAEEFAEKMTKAEYVGLYTLDTREPVGLLTMPLKR